MSPLAIVVVIVVALVILLFIGGSVAARRRAASREGQFREAIARADRSLEAARAADRGWDPIRLEQAARVALERERPDFHYDKLQLVLVDDRPGTDEDRAELAAVGRGTVVHVSVIRRGDEWVAQDVH